MQNYKDPNGNIHALSATDIENGYADRLPAGSVEISQADADAITNPVPSLGQKQAEQIAIIDAAYVSAVQLPVTFKTAAGILKTYQADNVGPLSSQSVLLKTFTGYNIAGATPTGFYWQAADNAQVPFTLADLAGLYGAMLSQGNIAFNQRAILKAAIRAAQSISEIEGIVWPQPAAS